MESREPQRNTLLLLLLFALGCVVLTLAAYRALGGATPFMPKGYRFDIALPNAERLLPGSDVSTAGVKIGHVVRVRRVGSSAVATLELAEKYAPIRSNATAIARTKTLLGEAYLELGPGSPDAPLVEDGGMLPASQVRPTVSFARFLQTFTPTTRARTRDLFQGLSTALEHRDTALNASLGYAAPVAANIAAVLDSLDRETVHLRQLIRDSGTVLTTLGERQGDVRAAVTAGELVLRTTAERNRELAATVKALPPFLTVLEATSRRITASSGDLNRAVAALSPSAPLLPPVLANINQYGPDFRAVFRDLPDTIAAGRRGLPVLTQILDRIPTAFRQLYPTARQLEPILELFATYKNSSLIAPLANSGSALNGVAVGPGGRISHRAGGALFLSNETPVGWVDRLPTNRSNPYQTPTGLKDLGTIGFLKSYDCRHVNNVLWLPPLGTGVPPCVEQGPWTYKGVTAYYPRLRASPP